MGYVILFAIGVPLFALVFSGVVLLLGLVWERFRTSGPGGFGMLYLKFLIIAAVYMVLAVVGIGGLLGLMIMALAYKYVFGAGWVEALIIGIVGGIIGWVAFIGIVAALVDMGLKLG